MKKKLLLFICVLTACLLLAGCDTKSTGELPPGVEALQEPVLEWWDVYAPTGYNTVTALIKNPNDYAIDTEFDLVFYKDGSEVDRVEHCKNGSIAPGAEDVVWENIGVPDSADVDEMRLENVLVSITTRPPVEGSYEYKGVIDGMACYDFVFEKDVEVAAISLVQYNDYNGNGQLDQGEIVVVNTGSLLKKEGTVSYEADAFESTDCAVYFKAY